MAAFAIAALMAAASPGSAGPDAAAIAELDYRAGQSLCQDFHHAVPCRDWRKIVSDVRCRPDPDDPRRAACTFVQRIPRVRGSRTCSAIFERSGGQWHYPYRPLDGPAPHPFPSLALTGPACSATGAPDAAAIAAIRAAVHSKLVCVVYAEAKRACPAPSAAVREVDCNWGTSERVAHCAYRLFAPGEYYCRARFDRTRRAWMMDSYRGVDGRLAFDEYCSGPVAR